MILNRIYKDYCLPLDLYIMLRKNLKYEYQKDFQDINKYVDDLPNILRIKVSLYIYEERYRKIRFFKKVLSASFITWICPQMKPQIQGENQFIYNEGDEIQCVYFLVSGRAGFVLPQYENVKYIDIKDGDKFGIIDIYASTEKMNI